MKKSKIIVGVLFFLIVIASNLAIFSYEEDVADIPVELHVVANSDNDTTIQTYFLQKNYENEKFSNNHMLEFAVNKNASDNDYSVVIPTDTTALRVNSTIGDVEVKQVYIKFKDVIIENFDVSDATYNSIDKYYSWKVDCTKTTAAVKEGRKIRNLVLNIVICAVIDVLLLVIWFNLEKLMIIPSEIISTRKLIVGLAKNDFKQKFAGSYLGTVWAFVQPIITVLVYWFVFEKALNVGTQSTKAGIQVPFVLWLIAGLVPWFYFSEVLASGANALVEYNYLVKKVVFKISALPIVKTISSLFVHGAFVVFAIVLYSCYGYFPSLYTLQVIYYSLCMFLLCVGLTYLTSAIMVFFRDLGQIIGVLLQVGMWMTPIMWNMDAMANRIPGWVLVILKLNPMYYIVNGYRDALYNNMWFWERPGLTIYNWLLIVIVFIVGTSVFRKLQQHFADVL